MKTPREFRTSRSIEGRRPHSGEYFFRHQTYQWDVQNVARERGIRGGDFPSELRFSSGELPLENIATITDQLKNMGTANGLQRHDALHLDGMFLDHEGFYTMIEEAENANLGREIIDGVDLPSSKVKAVASYFRGLSKRLRGAGDRQNGYVSLVFDYCIMTDAAIDEIVKPLSQTPMPFAIFVTNSHLSPEGLAKLGTAVETNNAGFMFIQKNNKDMKQSIRQGKQLERNRVLLGRLTSRPNELTAWDMLDIEEFIPIGSREFNATLASLRLHAMGEKNKYEADFFEEMGNIRVARKRGENPKRPERPAADGKVYRFEDYFDRPRNP